MRGLTKRSTQKLACGLVAILALLPTPLQAAPAHVLANEKIRVALSADGKVDSVANLLASETYSFSSDSFALDTDLGLYSNSNVQPSRVTADKERVVYHFYLALSQTRFLNINYQFFHPLPQMPRSERDKDYFEVGDEINLQAGGDYQFVELYPSDREKVILDDHGQSVFALGEKASLTVPAYHCCLLELRKAAPQGRPVLVGAAGEVALAGGRMAITGVTAQPGETAAIRVRASEPQTVQSVTVNGVEQKFTRTAREICLEVRFGGDKYVRALDVWTQPDGQRFDFPYHTAQPELQLTTTFKLNANVRQLLEKARPKNFAEMDAKIAGWQTPEGRRHASYSYHNFIGERPSRLWLVLPFLTRAGVEVALNGEKVEALRWDDPSSSAFADVTDRVKYGEENHLTLSLKGLAPNQFMGPFLLYPEEAATDQVLPAAGQADQPVRYTRPLVSPPRPRYRKGAGPKVLEAQMMDHVTLREAAELRVKVDLPPEKLKRVMFFESGFGWMGQHHLGYNREAQCWTARVEPGNRAAIQENDSIYVWAEGADGLRGDYYPVKVGWDFTRQSRQAKVVAGAIEGESVRQGARIVTMHGVPTLEADGVPFLLIGAQCDIWRSTRQDDKTVAFFDGYRKINATAVSVGIPWSKIETAEDRYDFRFLDWFIEQAQTRGLKLVVNLFNSNVCGKVREAAGSPFDPGYTPSYILAAPTNYQRMVLPGPWKYDWGGPPMCPNDPRTLERERRLCVQVAAHLKQTDVHRTVIMLQLDNEFVREGARSRWVDADHFTVALGDLRINVSGSVAGIIAKIAPTEVVLAIPKGRVAVEGPPLFKVTEGRFERDRWLPDRESAVRIEGKATVFEIQEPKVILLRTQDETRSATKGTP